MSEEIEQKIENKVKEAVLAAFGQDIREIVENIKSKCMIHGDENKIMECVEAELKTLEEQKSEQQEQEVGENK